MQSLVAQRVKYIGATENAACGKCRTWMDQIARLKMEDHIIQWHAYKVSTF